MAQKSVRDDIRDFERSLEEVRDLQRYLENATARGMSINISSAIDNAISACQRQIEHIERSLYDLRDQANASDDEYRSDIRPSEAKTTPGAHTAYNGR